MKKKLSIIIPSIIIVILLGIIAYQFAKSQFGPSTTTDSSSQGKDMAPVQGGHNMSVPPNAPPLKDAKPN